MTRQLLSVPFAALLVAGGLAVASPGAQAQQQPEQRGPGMTQQHPGAQAQPEQRGPGRQGMRERGYRHGMMHRGMGRDYGMRGMMDRRGMQAMRGHRMMHERMLRTLIILMDTDGDGALSLEEVQAVTERFFNAMDADNDGRLTMEEIRAFYGRPGTMPGMEMEDHEVELDDDEEDDEPGQAQ